MTPITILSTATAQERVRVSQRLTPVWASAGRRLLPIALMLVGSGLGGVGLGWAIGLPLSPALLVSLYSMIGTCLGFGLSRVINGRVQMRELMRSAALNGPAPVVLDAQGVTLPERSFRWAQVHAVRRGKDGIILLWSRADGLLLPERDLPEGLSPEDLLAQLSTWKAAQ